MGIDQPEKWEGTAPPFNPQKVVKVPFGFVGNIDSKPQLKFKTKPGGVGFYDKLFPKPKHPKAAG